ncbi:MAG TPA: hypothetical protein ENN41_03745 [Sediminispirochaeta sp.]|nr:hypothetical protein [Sediminispirochaeta sp.]
MGGVEYKTQINKLDTISLFAALSLFLSIVELLIPKPIPFLRIGLANLPLLVALSFFSTREFLTLVLLKIFGQAIVGGTLFSYVFLFSAVGSLSSAVIMMMLRNLYPRYIGMIGIGVFGAFGSNVAQLFFAAWMIFGGSTKYIAPLFLLVGTLSGALLGGITDFVLTRSHWLRSYGGSTGVVHPSEKGLAAEHQGHKSSQALYLLLIGLLMIPAFVLQSQLWLKGLQMALILLYGLCLGGRVRILPGLLLVSAVTAASLLTPLGRVIGSVLDFPITLGALEQGLHRGLNLVGLVYISRSAVSSKLRIPGRLGNLLYRVFFYFEELTSIRLHRGRSENFLSGIKERLLYIDQALLNWARGGQLSAEERRERGSAHRGDSMNILYPALFLGIHWFLFLSAEIFPDFWLTLLT